MYEILKYRYKHTKNYRVLIFCVFFSLFLSSCGIPTFLTLEEGKQNDVSYYEFTSNNNSDDSITTNLKFNIIKDGDKDLYNTPSICYFYAIYQSNLTVSENNFDQYITNEFNNTYAHKNPGKRLSISNDDPFVLKKEIYDEDIKLYKFTYNDLYQIPLSYLASAYDNFIYNNDFNVNCTISYDSSLLSFNFNELDSILTSLDSTGNYVDSVNLKLNRYNKDPFISVSSNLSDKDLDYLSMNIDEYDNQNISFKVYVYAALTVEGDFTNIFWSNLHKVGIFEL